MTKKKKKLQQCRSHDRLDKTDMLLLNSVMYVVRMNCEWHSMNYVICAGLKKARVCWNNFPLH